MKKLLLSVAILTASAGVALADIGAGLIGNTVTLTGPDGAETKIYYPDASTLVMKIPTGAEIPGTWRVDGETICTTAGDQPENCTPPITEAPTPGASGTIDGDAGSVAWAVTAGKDF
ncbi:MAG: hypothetical protein COA62_11960 [Rhodobiaceae bacterium]|nr:MAG: hypothetical protein COA62_11960 [Rhodobiaceae bacterium]